MCGIYAGVDSCDAADSGNMSAVSVAAESYWPIPNTHSGLSIPNSHFDGFAQAGAGALLPITGRKYQSVIVAYNNHSVCVESKHQAVSDKEL